MKIRVTECWNGGSREQTVTTWEFFERYARDTLPDDMLARMKAELETTGTARIDGDGYWFSYEKIEG